MPIALPRASHAQVWGRCVPASGSPEPRTHFAKAPLPQSFGIFDPRETFLDELVDMRTLLTLCPPGSAMRCTKPQLTHAWGLTQG